MKDYKGSYSVKGKNDDTYIGELEVKASDPVQAYDYFERIIANTYPQLCLVYLAVRPADELLGRHS